MDTIVLAMCGVWFWLTRGRRIRDYRSAAYTLTVARACLQNEFGSHASTQDRGILLPSQIEALEILEAHASSTYQMADRFHSLRECCRYVAQELTPLTHKPQVTAPVLRPHLVHPVAARSSAVRIRLALPRTGLQPGFLRPLVAWDLVALWKQAVSIWPLRRSSPTLTAATAEQQPLPLKAA